MNETIEIGIEVVLAEPTRCQKIALKVKPGTTARDALKQAVAEGLDLESLALDAGTAPLGIYALKVDDDYSMNEGDRLEVYRALKQDPMELRRQRARKDAAQRRKK